MTGRLTRFKGNGMKSRGRCVGKKVGFFLCVYITIIHWMVVPIVLCVFHFQQWKKQRKQLYGAALASRTNKTKGKEVAVSKKYRARFRVLVVSQTVPEGASMCTLNMTPVVVLKETKEAVKCYKVRIQSVGR
jgi:hypothetical protein